MTFPMFVPPPRAAAAFVLDASVPAAWAIPRQCTVYVHRVQLHLISAPCVVSTGWAFEVADLLRLVLRLGQTTQPRVDRAVNTLTSLPIYVDDQGPFRVWPSIADLALTHTLSVRDAACLELALRTSLPLATVDPALLSAAPAVGVPIFTP